MTDLLRVVLVGCGSMSNTWLDTARSIPDLAIVGLVDLDRAAAEAKAAAYDLKNAAIDTDLQRVLDHTRPDIVFDCSIPAAHVAVTTTALQHGCHVLGEKPLADSLAHAQRSVASAQQANRVYAVMQNRRYDANIRRLHALLQSDAIGSLTTVNADFYLGAHFGGFRDRMEHVLLLDMAIHTFDAARLLIGADPVAVYCHEWNPRGSWYDHDASAIAIFEMSNGVVFTYRGSWCAEGLNTSWESDWRIVGERGSVMWDGADQFRAEAVAATGGFRSTMRPLDVPPWDRSDQIGAHDGLIRDFVACIRQGRTPETICADNIKSLAMVFAAIESAEQGRKVDVKY